MSKMDAQSMQDVYILSPVSGLYSTRSEDGTSSRLMMIIMLIVMILLITLIIVLITFLSPGRSWV